MKHFSILLFVAFSLNANAFAYERSAKDQAEWLKMRAEQKVRDDAQARDKTRPWDRKPSAPEDAVTKPTPPPQ